MQIDCQDFLDLCQESGRLVTWDIEATGLNCDYNSILCVSLKPFGKSPVTFRAASPGNDRRLCKDVRDFLAEAQCWVTFYGKGFDVPMLEGRLLKWKLPSLVKKPHCDVFFQLVGKVKTSRKSQAHIASWLDLPEKKMSMSPDEWNLVLSNYTKHIRKMERRCESDTMSLEDAYTRTRHIYKNVTR